MNGVEEGLWANVFKSPSECVGGARFRKGICFSHFGVFLCHAPTVYPHNYKEIRRVHNIVFFLPFIYFVTYFLELIQGAASLELELEGKGVPAQ